MSTFWSTNSVYCDIIDWDIVVSDGSGGYTVTTDYAWLSGVDSGTSLLRAKTSISTPLTGVIRYIRV